MPYPQGIETLCKYGFNSTDIAIAREALRCLANALLLAQETRQIFVDLGFAEKAAEKFKVSPCSPRGSYNLRGAFCSQCCLERFTR